VADVTVEITKKLRDYQNRIERLEKVEALSLSDELAHTLGSGIAASAGVALDASRHDHIHAITASSAPGAKVSILETNATGGITLAGSVTSQAVDFTSSTPAALAGDVNDWNLGNNTFIRASLQGLWLEPTGICSYSKTSARRIKSALPTSQAAVRRQTASSTLTRARLRSCRTMRLCISMMQRRPDGERSRIYRSTMTLSPSRIYGSLGQLGAAAKAAAVVFNFVVTTNGASQNVSIGAIKPVGADCVITWGDGTTTTITNGSTTGASRTYALAGTYYANITNPQVMRQWKIETNKVSWVAGEISKLTTITYLYTYTNSWACNYGEIGSLTTLQTLHFQQGLNGCLIGAGEIDNLVNLTYLHVASFYGTLVINSGELGNLHNLTYLVINHATVTATAAEIGTLHHLQTLYIAFNVALTAGCLDALTSLTSLTFYVNRGTCAAGVLNGLTALTSLVTDSTIAFTVGAGDVGSLTTLTTLNLYVSVTTTNITAAEIANLVNLITFRATTSKCFASPISTSFAALTKIKTIQYEAGLNQAQVDAVLAAIYGARASYILTGATPALDLLGASNAAPSGIYQDATPPTTGKEYAYALVNDPRAEGFKKWTVTTA
jgi:hypothetical protein